MIIHPSPLPDVEIPSMPITEYMLRLAGGHPDRPSVVDGVSGRAYTFAELDDRIHRFAGGLAARGFGFGDTLAIVAPNLPEYAIVFHGTAVAGGTVTTVNPTYGAEEIHFQLNDAGATLLVTISALAPAATEAVKGTRVREIILIDGGDGGTPLAEVYGDRLEQVPVDPLEHVVTLPYSSGTTGLPKGVMLTHHNLVTNLCQCVPLLPTDGTSVGLAVLPFFHIYGMQVLMNGMLAEGATIYTLPRFDLVQSLQIIQEHKVTHFYVVPPIVLALAKHPIVDQYDLSSLTCVFSGAAPLGAELAEEASARIGCTVVQGYGMTEMSPVSHGTPPGRAKPGTVGVTVPNAACRIVDPDTGEDQPVGGVGEVWVKGPLNMKGYLNNPQATAATIDDDGWLHTGDVGVFDDEGYLKIVDRVKELIKYKGFQVPPAELEALIITHPAVADVAVIGVPDEEAGELPKAFVVVKPDHQVSAADIVAFVEPHVATYKHIRIVEFIDEIPKSASGKILRRVLRDRS